MRHDTFALPPSIMGGAIAPSHFLSFLLVHHPSLNHGDPIADFAVLVTNLT